MAMTTHIDSIFTIVKAFDVFREAYDNYLLEVETALPDDVEEEALQERVRSLVLGSGDVSIYLRDYGYTVDSMRALLRR
jgi:hypothetical protein